MIPGFAQWVKDLALPGHIHKGGSVLALLWLWCRLAAVALIQPLAWEFPYATGVALKRKKKKKNKMEPEDIKWRISGMCPQENQM